MLHCDKSRTRRWAIYRTRRNSASMIVKSCNQIRMGDNPQISLKCTISLQSEDNRIHPYCRGTSQRPPCTSPFHAESWAWCFESFLRNKGKKRRSPPSWNPSSSLTSPSFDASQSQVSQIRSFLEFLQQELDSRQREGDKTIIPSYRIPKIIIQVPLPLFPPPVAGH